MTLANVRLVPALPEHVDVWLAMRAEPLARGLMPLDEDTRESLLKRLGESSSDVMDPRATCFRWMVEHEGRIAAGVGGEARGGCAPASLSDVEKVTASPAPSSRGPPSPRSPR